VIRLALVALVAAASPVAAQTLAWNANTESNLAGYRIQYGTNASSLSSTVDVGRVTPYRFTSLAAGTTYYFRVVAYNTSGQASSPSGQVSYTTPATPPSTPTPTVTAVSPASGPASGGTAITISGTNFASGATVRVGGNAAGSVTFVSATQLRATTPAGTAGARDVQVTNPSGALGTRIGAFTYTASSSTLTVSGVSPSSGPKSGGTVITVTGSGFVSGARVSIGTLVAGNVAFVSSTQLRATTPYSGSAGARDVRVTNPNSQYAIRTSGFTYTGNSSAPPPSSSLTVTSLSPASGPRSGGTVVTVTGSGFVSGARVSIGTLVASNVVFVSSTQLRATTPYSSTTGARDVRVTNPNSTYAVRGSGFSYSSATTATQTSASTFSRFLAEGAQTDQMSTQLAIANAEPADAKVNLTFMDADGQTTAIAVDVPARSRQTVDLATVPELAGRTFSTRVDANQPVAVDRVVALDAQGSSASLETAVDRPSATWYFAEGSTVDPMELFYLVQNPGTTPAKVQVRYLLPDGAPVTRIHDVAAGSRATIWVDREGAALASTDVAAEITSLDGTPIVVERSLYLKQDGVAQPRGGDTSAGATAPATSWFVETATGPFAARLLLANPGRQAAEVTATYQRQDGGRVVRAYSVAPASRRTVDVAAEDPTLADAELGITVEASAPIVVERSQLWGADGADQAISGGATTKGGSRWLLAEAEQGGTREAATDVVVVNRGAATDVTITLLFEDGPEVSQTFPLAAGARFAVPMAQAFPAAEGRRFSVLVEGADPSANLVVDRSIFWQAAGGSRTAGADGAAARLP